MNISENYKESVETPAANERFGMIAAITPQIMQCKLASYCSAGSSVEAATTPSRRTLEATAGRENGMEKFWDHELKLNNKY
jgi:hypothetical protein